MKKFRRNNFKSKLMFEPFKKKKVFPTSTKCNFQPKKKNTTCMYIELAKSNKSFRTSFKVFVKSFFLNKSQYLKLN